MQEIQWYKFIMPRDEYLADVDNTLWFRFNTAIELLNNNDFTETLLYCQLDINGNMIYYISHKGFQFMKKLLGKNNYSFSPCEQPIAKRPINHDFISFRSGDINLWNKILRDSGVLHK